MADVKIQDVTDYLESLAPLPLQESYDNAGLLTGDRVSQVKSVLVTLDCTEEVIDEAITLGSNLIIAHHPIIFKGLKKLTGSNYVERTVLKAVRNEIAIYAIHTNLDNVREGVNKKFAEKLGLKNTRILRPRVDALMKLETFIPKENADAVIRRLHEAGAGNVGNYSNCSFQVTGTGSFRPGPGTHPRIGSEGQQEFVEEVQVEMLFPAYLQRPILAALHEVHPYEEPAYFIHELSHENQEVGSGMIGTLDKPLELPVFLQRLRNTMNLKTFRYTPLPGKLIRQVAVCGGAGSFLLPDAVRAGADAFISADFKYHEFFESNGQIVIADVGHYESEVATKELLGGILSEKFTTFAVNFSKIDTNPIRHYI